MAQATGTKNFSKSGVHMCESAARAEPTVWLADTPARSDHLTVSPKCGVLVLHALLIRVRVLATAQIAETRPTNVAFSFNNCRLASGGSPNLADAQMSPRHFGIFPSLELLMVSIFLKVVMSRREVAAVTGESR